MKGLTKVFGFRRVEKRQERSTWKECGWRVDEAPEHDERERCPICGHRLKEDPIGGFYLKCPNCGWEGW